MYKQSTHPVESLLTTCKVQWKWFTKSNSRLAQREGDGMSWSQILTNSKQLIGLEKGNVRHKAESEQYSETDELLLFPGMVKKLNHNTPRTVFGFISKATYTLQLNSMVTPLRKTITSQRAKIILSDSEPRVWFTSEKCKWPQPHLHEICSVYRNKNCCKCSYITLRP